MRSTPSMTVLLRPGSPLPGTVLEVEAQFESETETPVDAITFELKGIERLRVPRGKSSLVRTHTHVELRAEHPAATFTPGTHTYRARFQLPKDLPPRYSGSYAWVDYTLVVRASVPWWLDAVGRYDVPIAPLPMAAPITPGIFVSRAGGPVPGELYAEMSLASTVVEAGGEIHGTVAFTNASKERGVRVALVAYEHVFSDGDFWSGGSVNELREAQRWTFTPTEGLPPEGAPLPFRFAVARNAVPSYRGAITSITWVVEVTADRLLTSREVLRAPIVIVPPTGRARTSSGAVPAIGRARRSQSFQRVAERVAMAYDEEHDGIRGAVGAIGLRIAVETRPDGELVTAAHLVWPSLGMRLRLAPSSWTDPFRSSEIEIGFGKFDDKFHVESRVPDQARALLDEQLCDLLLTFDEVRADDEGATLAVAMALTDEEPLAALVQRAVAAARQLDQAFTRVPPPPELAAHVDAWRAFAERVSGRWEPGRGAILEGTVGLERVELATQWTAEGKLDATEVRVPLGVRIDPAAVSPAARAIVKSLEEPEGQDIAIAEDVITLRLHRLVPDPAEIDPLIETLVRLAHAVRGRGAAGPFRS